MAISPELARMAGMAWGRAEAAPKPSRPGPAQPRAAVPHERPDGSRQAAAGSRQSADGRRPLTGELLKRLHGVAASGKFSGMAPADVHAELHRCACVFFGRDHLTDMSNAQGFLLYRWLKGEREIEPSPRRREKLDALERALDRGGQGVREHVMAVAATRFGAESLDDCGIGRLSALIRVASYYERRSP